MLNEDTHPVIRAIGVSQLAKMSFDEIFDLTAGVYVHFYENIRLYSCFEIPFRKSSVQTSSSRWHGVETTIDIILALSLQHDKGCRRGTGRSPRGPWL